MPIYRPDIVFSKSGKPIAAVEAKARPVSRDFQTTVWRQLSAYSTQMGAPWALLVDPQETYIFRSPDMQQPVARLQTSEVLGEAFTNRPGTVGEQVILVALDRVVPRLKSRPEFLQRHPELTEFADALAGAESTFDPDGRG